MDIMIFQFELEVNDTSIYDFGARGREKSTPLRASYAEVAMKAERGYEGRGEKYERYEG